jgi:hypothetical protein
MSDEVNDVIESIDKEIDALHKEIHADVSIGKDLFAEAESIATLTCKYAKLRALVESQEMLEDENVKTIRSKLILAISDNPKKFLGEIRSPTVAVIEACWRDHPTYRQAVDKQIAITTRRKLLEYAFPAIDNKRQAIYAMISAKGAGIYNR